MSDLPPQRRIELSNGTYATYRESGDGAVVVVVPGLGLTSRFYEKSYTTFAAAGLRLIVPDLPGTGETPGPRTGMHPDDVAQFMVDFAAALQLQCAVWVGHSLGTQAVLILAQTCPRLVAGIALVGATVEERAWKLGSQILGLARETLRVKPSVIGAVARDYVRVSPARYIGTWLRHRSGVEHAEMLQIGAPVLMMVGERDALIDHAFIERLVEALPDVTLLEVADGSHALPRSQYEEFNAAIVSFAHRVFAMR